MGSKKDFSGADMGRVYGAIEDSVSEWAEEDSVPQEPEEDDDENPETGISTYSDEQREIQTRKIEMRTQGKKGAKMQRINMAFTPANFNYIRLMSKYRGETMTQFVNAVLAQSKKRNEELYEREYQREYAAQLFETDDL